MSAHRLMGIALSLTLTLGGLATLSLISRPPIPSVDERVTAIASELRCPTCQGLSIADSPSTAAAEIRRQIGGLVAAGASDEAVKQHFVARYGEWILLSPRLTLAWLVPPLMLILGALGMLVWLRRARSQADARIPAEELAPFRERVRRETSELDG